MLYSFTPIAEFLLSFGKSINQGLPTSKKPSNKSEAEAGCILGFYKWNKGVPTSKLNKGGTSSLCPHAARDYLFKWTIGHWSENQQLLESRLIPPKMPQVWKCSCILMPSEKVQAHELFCVLCLLNISWIQLRKTATHSDNLIRHWISINYWNCFACLTHELSIFA